MKDGTASVAKQRSRQQCRVLRSSENKALSQSKAIQHYYGEIGIAAVAAAVRYQGDFKNAAYAPVAIEWYDRRHELELLERGLTEARSELTVRLKSPPR